MNNATRISFFHRRFLDLFRLYKASQTALHDLTYLFWECTLRCNLSCLHCGSDCMANSSIPDMPREDFLRVLDEIAQHNSPKKITIAVTGGEPLLRADLAQCGYEFCKRGYGWGMVSNGYNMTDERFRRLRDSGLGSLTISLDGMKKSHDWIRNRDGSFERAVHAIGLCAKEDGLIYDVVTCVCRKNFDELDELKKMLINMGVKRWRIFNIFPKGRAKGNEMLDIGSDQFARQIEFIRQSRKDGAIDTSYSCEGFLGAYEGSVREGPFWCRAGVNIGSVLIDGSVSACPSLRDDYIQGNIYKEKFVDIWENKFRIMRNRSWTKTGLCADCKMHKWCNGNGLHLRDEKTGDLLRCHYKMLEEANVAV